MIIDENSVTTDEVKHWQGVHLLHFQNSTCSHKVRLMLGELGVDYTSHPVNLIKHQNATPWFLGINPRGVVPVLVHDGVVHVESNDIITYLDQQFAKPGESYFFEDSARAAQAQSLLDLEDDLHTELRLLSMVFGPISPKTEQQINDQQNNGAYNEKREGEVRWWREQLANGTSEQDIAAACQAFSEAFSQLDARLADGPWLMGERISMVDIAWFVNLQRLVRVGYPLARHPRLEALYHRMLARPAFSAEAKHPGSRLGQAVFAACRLRNRLKGNQVAAYV